jgi:trk system potassium uptake protein TrkA
LEANQILKFVKGKAVESLLRIIDGQAEILEFVVDDASKLLNRSLKELSISGDIIIATIIRKNEIVVPHGNDVIKKGDRIIIITKDRNIASYNELVASISGGLQNELRNSIKKLGDSINM